MKRLPLLTAEEFVILFEALSVRMNIHTLCQQVEAAKLDELRRKLMFDTKDVEEEESGP